MTPPLPAALLEAPIAHRALHDSALGRPENSRAAIRAACAAGFGIEIDIQPSADGQPMVFHDYLLDRLTGEKGPIIQHSADTLGEIVLSGSHEGIPTLGECLDLVAGKVPVLVEIKDQDGALGPNIGPLERAVATLLNAYQGDIAVMSFNPHSVAEMRERAPDIARGLTTCAYTQAEWPEIPAAMRRRLRDIADFRATGASFISHDKSDLDRACVRALKDRGIPVLCWTVRSHEDEIRARRIADNITFEGYDPRNTQLDADAGDAK